MNRDTRNIPDELLDLLPAYERIKVALIRQIEANEFPPGSRLPSESALCQMFGVSRITTSRALNDLAQAGVVERRQGVGTFVAERPAPTDEGDQPAKPAIGLLVRRLAKQFDLRVVEGAEAVLSEAGYGLVLYNSRGSEEREAALLAELMHDETSGVLAMPMSMPAGNVAYRRFCESGKTLVLVDIQIEGLKCDIVTEDNEGGGYQLTAFLLQRGHRRIAFIPPLDAYTSTTQDRYRGYRRAHEAFGVPLRDALYLKSGCERCMPDAEVIATLQPIFEAVPPPTAVVCANDRPAAAVDLYLHLNPARTVEIAYFESYDPYYLTTPPVARMIQFPEKMGARAAELLLDRIEQRRSDPEPVCIFLPQRLVTNE